MAFSYKYDVFLSFRGVDSRDFASYLRAALHERNIKTCCTDKKKIPEEEEMLGPQSFKAIKESKTSVIIFSENYAFSAWCLEELAHILECREKMGQVVVPVFYNVYPSDVRNQRGNYATAFSFHEERLKHDRNNKLQQWRDALTEAASLSGWHTREYWSESKLVEEVVRDIQRNLNRTLLGADMKGLVGIEKRIEEINKLLCIGSHDIRVIGIWGLGGIGKTTLARVVYKHLSSQFEDSYFLANVREESKRSGLVSLQRKLITELFEEEDTSAESPTIVKGMQKSKRVLLVLDDVDDPEQFEILAREQYKWFSAGSRIMVTARDAQVLSNITADEVYKVEELNDDEAMQLFQLNAVKRNFPAKDYLKESKRIVEYCKGLPLAINVFGSYFRSRRKETWETDMIKLKKVPNFKIQLALRISYDGLDDVEKKAFLDIACFHKGKDREFVEQFLGHGSISSIIIDSLIDKSLLTIKHNKLLWMHDLIQQMGWEIVYQESIKEPGKRSRLWNSEDIYHVLEADTGSAAIEGISLETSHIKEMDLLPTVFKEMHRLRFLKISSYDDNTKKRKVNFPQGLESLPDSLQYLHWDGYPLKCLPLNFSPQNLVGLVITNSHIEQLWPEVKDLRHLKLLDLSYSKQITKIPDFYDQAPNLECIVLQFCTSLVQILSSFQYLDKLRILSLRGCSSIEEFPILPRNIRNLDLSETLIRQVPSSIGQLRHLETLNLNMCKNLRLLPESISSLKSLKKLSIVDCISLETLSLSRMALTQGRDDYSFQHSSGRFDFINCLKMEEDARTNTMDAAQLTFLSKATSSSKDEEGRMFEIWYPGDKIPKWYSFQSEGSSIQVELPPNWCATNFLGFALGVNIGFKDCCIDADFDLYFQFDLVVDFDLNFQPVEFVNDILTFNWKNDLVRHNHFTIVDSEYVFLFNYHKNSFIGTYNNIAKASFKFYSNKRGCNVKKCGVHPLYTDDVKKIIYDATQHVGKFSEIEDVTTDFKKVDLIHEPEASGSLNVHDAHTKKEEDTEKRCHDIDQDVAESSKREIEEEEEEDLTSDFKNSTSSYKHEPSGSHNIHEADAKKEEDGDVNPSENYHKTEPTYSCSCLMFLSHVVDIFKHVFGRQWELHGEKPLQEPDKVLYSIMTELVEHNKRISQHLQTVMPKTSHVSYDSLEPLPTSRVTPSHSTAIEIMTELGEHNKRISQHLQTVMPKASHESYDYLEPSPTYRVAPSNSTAIEKDLTESPEEIIDSLCSQIIGVRDQNKEILQNLRALVPTDPDNQFSELFAESTLSSSASRINDLFKDVIANEQYVEVPEEVINSLRSQLTELRDHNQQILQFLRIAMSNSPTPTNRFSGEFIKAAGSSSSCIIPTNPKKYDVFISFHGVDTRKIFTSHLYKALSEKNINTYIDDNTYIDGDSFKKGEDVSSSLLKVIEESKICLIIFSENYASSRWCLDELNYVLQRKNQHGHVVPIFYRVSRSHVGNQQGSYEGAFAAREKRFTDKEDKVKQWKGALERAATLPGWDSSEIRDDIKLVEAIVNDVLQKLSVMLPSGYEYKHLVGIEKRIEQVKSLLQKESSDVRIVGIWGVAGIGKTTLAHAIFNLIASEFESRCFLVNVSRETKKHGLFHLQNKLFSELLEEKNLNMVNWFEKEKLFRKKALLVLDDVDALEQFEYLAEDCDWFGPGSRIIITTCDVQLLYDIEVDGMYNVEELNFDEALQLFCSKAFRGFSVPSHFMELSKRVIDHAKGIPLVLEDLGRRLYSKGIEEWESELSRLQKGSQF